MKNITILSLLTSLLLISGCGDNIDSWEFQTELPPSTTPAELSKIEQLLDQNGYSKVAIRPRYSDTLGTPALVGIQVFATRTPQAAITPKGNSNER